jgi:hypothetical protein
MGVTHIVIYPTSRLVGLSVLSITSGIIAICLRATTRRFSRQMQPHFPAHASAPPSRRPHRGPLAAPCRLAVFGAPVASAAAAAAASSWALWLDPTCRGRGGGGRT